MKRATPLTSWFIGINVAVAVAQLFLGSPGPSNPVEHYLALKWVDFTNGRVWELFTYMWVHADFIGWGCLHIIFNMMTLSVFGPVVETQMGRRHFLGIYFGAGITAGLFYLGEVFLRIQTGFATFETLHMPLVGASGAVLGLAVAFAFLFPSARLFVFPLPFPVKARTAMIGFVILSVILIFFTVAKGIAHSAHLGGMAFGTGYMLWLRRRVRCSRQGGERGVLESDPSGWDMPTLRRELEPILTKISSHGLAGLSERERTVLREAQRRFG